jgi:FkbM family methyltransferase
MLQLAEEAIAFPLSSSRVKAMASQKTRKIPSQYMHKLLTEMLRLMLAAVTKPRTIVAKLRGADATPYGYLTEGIFPRLEIATVIDVGANVGRWSKACRLALPELRICAFEPVMECYLQLVRRFKADVQVECYNSAIGSAICKLDLKIHEHASSSSLMDVNGSAVPISGSPRIVGSIPIAVDTLDRLWSDRKWAGPFLVKLDVQGFELEVLRGAENLLQECSAIIVETSFHTLYTGQPLFHDIYDWLHTRGFTYAGPLAIVLKSSSGMLVQQDSLFVKKCLLERLWTDAIQQSVNAQQ